MTKTIDFVNDFNNKYSGTIHWRTKKHCKLIDKYLSDNEHVIFAFAAQNDSSHGSIFNTAALAVTNERLIIAQDRILIGYKVTSITPELYNDLQINAGIIWGVVTIDTIKETILFSNIAKKALPEIQKKISSFMIEAKKKYYNSNKENS